MRRLLVVLALLLPVACATIPTPSPPADAEPPPQEQQSGQPAWWYARFNIEWPDDQDPALHLGPMLADQVVAPVLAAHRENIRLWRFHRRAGRDAAGHDFSFIFYSTPSAARAIFAALDDSVVLRELEARGRVHLQIDDTKHPERLGLAATSDPNWSAELAQAWPYYIMGVSELWLKLVQRYAESEVSPDADIVALEAAYRRVDERVSDTWRMEGEHALLHHLSGVFGYRPIIITERRLLRF